MPDFFIANTTEGYIIAATLFKEYAAWVNIDLSFQNFENELKEISNMYAAPAGAIILCKNKNEFVGCVAIRKIDNETAEFKRMYVRPRWQGKGIGKDLLNKAIEFAKAANYSCIRLDTLKYMLRAINLYKQFGFYEIPAYYHNPNETAVYFEIKC